MTIKTDISDLTSLPLPDRQPPPCYSLFHLPLIANAVPSSMWLGFDEGSGAEHRRPKTTTAKTEISEPTPLPLPDH